MPEINLSSYKNLGLTEIEAKTYVELFSNYYRTAEEVYAALSELESLEITKSTLESLIEKKFVKKIIGRIDLFIALPPSIVIVANAQEKIEATLNETSQSIKAQWDEATSTIDIKLNTYMDNLNVTLQKGEEESSSYISKINDDFAAIDKSITTTSNKVESLEQSNQSVSQNIISDLEKKSNSVITKLESEIGEILKNSEINLQNVGEASQVLINKLHNDRKSELDTFIEFGRNKFLVKTEEGIKLSQEIQEKAKIMNTKFANEIDNFITQSKTLFSNLNIVDEFVQSSKIFDDLGQRVGNNYENKLKETIKELQRSIKYSDEALKKLLESHKNNTTKLSQGIQESLLKELNSNIPRLTKLVESSGDKSENLLIDSKNSINLIVKQTQKDFQQKIEKQLNMLTDKLGTTKSNSEETMASFKNEILENFTKQIKILQSKMKNTSGSIVKNVEDTIKITNDDITETNDQILVNLESNRKNLDNFLLDINNKTEQSINQFKSTIIGYNEKIGKEIADKGKSSFTEIDNALKSELEHFSRLINEQFNSLGTSSSMILGTTQNSLASKTRVVLDSLKNQSIDSQTKLIQKYLEIQNQERANYENKQQDLLKEVDNVVKIIGSQKNELGEEKAKHFEQIANEITSNHKNKLNIELTELQKNIQKNSQDLREKMPSDMDLLITTQSENLNSAQNEIAGKLSGFSDIFEKLIFPIFEKKKLGKTETADLSEKLHKMDDELNELRNTVFDRIGNVDEGLKEEKNKLIDNFVKSIQNTDHRSQGTIDDLSDTLENNVEELDKQLTTKITSVLISAAEEDSTKLGSLENASSQLKERINSSFESFSNSLVSIQDDLINKKDFVVKEIENKTLSLIEEIETELDSNIKTLEVALTSMNEQAGQEIETSANAIGKKLNKGIKANTTEYEQINIKFNEFTEKNKENIDKFSLVIDSHLKQTSEKIQLTITDLETTIGNLKENLTNSTEGYKSIITHLNSFDKEHNNFLTILDKELNTLIEEQVSKSSNNLMTSLDENKEQIVKLLQKSNEISDKAINATQDSLSSQFTEITTDLNKVFLELSGNMNKFVTELGSASKSFVKLRNVIIKEQTKESNAIGIEVKGIIEKEINKLNSAVKIVNKDVNDTIKSLQTEREEMARELSLKLDKSNDEQRRSLDSYYSSFKDESNKIISENTENNDKLIADFEKVRSNASMELQKANENHIGLIESTKESLTNLSQKNIKEMITDNNNKLNDSKDQMRTLLKAQTTKMKQQMQKNTQEVSKTIDKLRTDYEKVTKEKLIDLKTTISSVDNDMLITFKNQMKDVEEKTVSIKDDLKSSVNKQIERLPETIASAIKDTSDIMKFVKEVHSYSMESEPSAVSSTVLITGKSRSQELISAALLRTKSTTKFIVPKITDMPVKAFASIKKTSRIQGLSNIDDKEHLAKIKEVFPNIDIRHYERINVYGFIRDGNEEGGIGSTSKGNIDFIHTENEDLIATFNEIFQDLWPRAKKA